MGFSPEHRSAQPVQQQVEQSGGLLSLFRLAGNEGSASERHHHVQRQNIGTEGAVSSTGFDETDTLMVIAESIDDVGTVSSRSRWRSAPERGGAAVTFACAGRRPDLRHLRVADLIADRKADERAHR